MVESVSLKPRVIVIGTKRTGKSTVMNCLSSAEEEKFEAKRSVVGVTTEFKEETFERFILIDTPGLNDQRIPLVKWSDRFNNSKATT